MSSEHKNAEETEDLLPSSTSDDTPEDGPVSNELGNEDLDDVSGGWVEKTGRP